MTLLSLESRRIEISSKREKQVNEEAKREATWFQEVVRKLQGSQNLADRVQPSCGENVSTETWRRNGGQQGMFQLAVCLSIFWKEVSSSTTPNASALERLVSGGSTLEEGKSNVLTDIVSQPSQSTWLAVGCLPPCLSSLLMSLPAH